METKLVEMMRVYYYRMKGAAYFWIWVGWLVWAFLALWLVQL